MIQCFANPIFGLFSVEENDLVFADECLGGVVEKARHEKNPLHSCWVRIYRILGSFAKVSIFILCPLQRGQ